MKVFKHVINSIAAALILSVGFYLILMFSIIPVVWIAASDFKEAAHFTVFQAGPILSWLAFVVILFIALVDY